ncbi:MAG: MBL fold metallo-hydrolase, partial [Vicinamibacterales bacterium]|nr:MBL fold metallo-hydrolase [Vicinamibacterales bacterium]
MDITLVPGFNPVPYTGAGNNTYVISGEIPTLVDAATGKAAHLTALAEALASTRLAQVLVTHAHPDHANGCDPIAERWSDAV